MHAFFLVRHSYAEPSHPLGDRARPLTTHGRMVWEQHIHGLRSRLQVQRIICSPYTRTRQTAEIMSRILSISVEEHADLASGQLSGREILRLARELGPGVALVGHNPELGEAIHAASGKSIAVTPGTVAAFMDDPAGVQLQWYQSPP